MLPGISKFTIRLTGLIFLLFGLACVVAPTEILHAATGSSITHPVALIDIRATYGGMSIGVAAMLFLLASSSTTLRAGLFSVLALMLGMAGGRLVGIFIEPALNGVMMAYLILELLAAAVSAILLYKLSHAGELQ